MLLISQEPPSPKRKVVEVGDAAVPKETPAASRVTPPNGATSELLRESARRRLTYAEQQLQLQGGVDDGAAAASGPSPQARSERSPRATAVSGSPDEQAGAAASTAAVAVARPSHTRKNSKWPTLPLAVSMRERKTSSAKERRDVRPATHPPRTRA
jgi:hypothetical protein